MNKMQKFLLALLIVMLVGIGAGGIMVFKSIGDQLSVPSQNAAPIEETASYPMDGLESLSISSVSADIEIVKADNQEITAELSGTTVLGDDKSPTVKLVTGVSGNRLNINVEHQVSFNITNTHLNLKVYVPEEYQGSVEIASTSGNAQIDELHLQDFKITLVSGDLIANRIQALRADLGTTSGDIQINSLGAELKVETISGNIQISLPTLDGDIDVKTVSGNTELSLPPDASFILNADSTSGNLTCAFPVTITDKPGHNSMNGTVSAGERTIQTQSVSGNITISK